MRKVIWIAPLALLGACQTLVTTPPASCSEFIPPAWKLPIPGASLPGDDELKSWQIFGVEQTGQLNKSNGRSGDLIHIFETCEKQANSARPRRKILGIF